MALSVWVIMITLGMDFEPKCTCRCRKGVCAIGMFVRCESPKIHLKRTTTLYKHSTGSRYGFYHSFIF